MKGKLSVFEIMEKFTHEQDISIFLEALTFLYVFERRKLSFCTPYMLSKVFKVSTIQSERRMMYDKKIRNKNINTD